MKKLVAILLAVLMVAALFTGCAPKAETPDEPAKDESAKDDVVKDEPATDEPAEDSSADALPFELESGVVPTYDDIVIPDGVELTIGYLAQNDSDQFNVFLGQVIEDEIAKYDGKIKLIRSDAQSQASVQVSQAEDMAIKTPDVVIMNAVDKEASAPAVQKLVDAGIPVVLLNTNVANVELATSYVGIDDYEVGVLLAQMVGEALDGEGTVNVIQGLLGHPANERRWVGVQDEFKANWPNITIGSSQAADWDRGKAMNVTEDWISAGAESFDAILSLNDEMAIASGNALQAANIDVPIVGADALDEMLDLIVEGKMYGTVFQNGNVESRCAVSVAIAAALGVTVDHEYMIPNEVVTAENVESYIGRNTLPA